MATCTLCGRDSVTVSSALGVCLDCLRTRPDALDVVRSRRAKWRARLGLPPSPPRSSQGARCGICVNECSIPPGGRGYCGVWLNRNGVLRSVAGRGMYAALYYLDPHPTNCVAGPVCPANTGRGYPRFTFTRGVERGYYNLAVFMLGCPLDCAFCQNWEHKTLLPRVQRGYAKSGEELLAAALDERVTCVCYFGGDPTPHAPLLISLSRRIVEAARRRGGRIPRVCWETDGLVAPALMREMARLSLETGGIVKVDWKAWSPSVYEALTGVDGRRALERLKENTWMVARMAAERGEPPLLVVSVLLVPGYVDAAEVRGVAGYVRKLEEETGARIPVVLLAFHGEHLMRDLPPTSRRHMEEALKAVREAGVSEVYVGNEWLLGDYY